MALMIKNAAADRAVRELAHRTGETIADAVRIAAEQRLATLPPERKGRIDHAELERVLTRIRSYPRTNEHLTDDEILGYDENGLPT